MTRCPKWRPRCLSRNFTLWSVVTTILAPFVQPTCARFASMVSDRTLLSCRTNRRCAAGRAPSFHRCVVRSAGSGVDTVVGPVVTDFTAGSRIAKEWAETDARAPGLEVVDRIRVTQYA